MLKQYILDVTENAIKSALKDSALGQMKESDEFSLKTEIPKNDDFGDIAVNVSSLSRFAKMAPPQIAQKIADYIELEDCEVTTVAGFINFKLGKSFLNAIVEEILNNKSEYGSNDYGEGQKVILEYVSANPTGPFHIGHGRWAAMGSALANLMKFAGYDVYQEFYVNDAGNQIKNLGRSLYIRVLQELGEKVDFPVDETERKAFYPGEYLVPLAKAFVAENKSVAEALPKNIKELQTQQLDILSNYAKIKMLNLQKELLIKFRTHFDNFYFETDLHKSGKVEACVNKLKEKNMLYKKDDAIWFKSSLFGDDQDRVLRKSDGSNTYLTADIAYHHDKIQRGFDKLINIWGADHHGYVPRMKASIEALGDNPDKLEVLLGQLVNIVMNGEAVRMGKRKNMVTLEDLVDEVGVDATRYWMIIRSIDTTLDFDIELAKSKTDENPVFYVQYAHARACSIFRNASNERVNVETKEKISPLFSEEELDEAVMNADLDLLWSVDDEKSFASAKKLILKLEEFKPVVLAAAKLRAPYIICKYLQELAGAFHQFYTFSRVLSDDKKLSASRLALVKAVSTVIKTALDLLAVDAPERM
ncbi:MAG: arginine--tRNA ligase [Clostridium sp.]|nr:arginine--tRNA ligase [Clostridium sp.]